MTLTAHAPPFIIAVASINHEGRNRRSPRINPSVTRMPFAGFCWFFCCLCSASTGEIVILRQYNCCCMVFHGLFFAIISPQQHEQLLRPSIICALCLPANNQQPQQPQQHKQSQTITAKSQTITANPPTSEETQHGSIRVAPSRQANSSASALARAAVAPPKAVLAAKAAGSVS